MLPSPAFYRAAAALANNVAHTGSDALRTGLMWTWAHPSLGDKCPHTHRSNVMIRLICLHRQSTALIILTIAIAVLVFSSASSASAQAIPTRDARWFELPNHDKVRVYLDSGGASGVEKVYEYAASGVTSPRNALAGDCRSITLAKPQLVNAPGGKLYTAAPEFRWILGANKVDGMQFHLIVENQVGVSFSLFGNASAPELWIFPDNFSANRTYTWRSYYSCTLNGRSGPVASGSFVAGSGEGKPSNAALLTPEDKSLILNTNNSGQIDYTWNGNAQLFILEFQLRNDPDWPDPSLWAAYGVWQAGTSQRTSVFSPGKEIAWRVRSHNAAGNSDPWQGYTFKVVSQLPAFSVTGRVVDVTGQGVPDVLIRDDKGVKAYTGQDGHYTLPNVLYGKRTITAERYRLTFARYSQQIDVRADSTAPDFRMIARPIVIVHGIQTFASNDTKCSEGVIRYKTPADSMLGDMPDMLSVLGNVIFIAHLDSGRSSTNYIEVNALCLEEQIKQVYAQSGNTKVIIVAHSMGGLVARACLASEACRSKVLALYTLGTPHTGTMVMSIPQFWADLLGTDFCEKQAALCQLDKIYISAYFNPYYPNQHGIQYYFIGGDDSPWYVMDQVTAPWEPHDGLVGSYSAVGWLTELNAILEPDWSKPSKPTRYWTDEVHTDFFGDKAYDRLRNGQPSQSANCIISGILALPVPAECRKASFTLPKATVNVPPPQVTRWISGSVGAGGPVTHTVQIDARGEARFSVLWAGSPLQVTLRTPDGLEISPGSAAAAPDQFAYRLVEQSPELPGMASYLVANAQPGAWSIVIGTSDAVCAQLCRLCRGFVPACPDRQLQPFCGSEWCSRRDHCIACSGCGAPCTRRSGYFHAAGTGWYFDDC